MWGRGGRGTLKFRGGGVEEEANDKAPHASADGPRVSPARRLLPALAALVVAAVSAGAASAFPFAFSAPAAGAAAPSAPAPAAAAQADGGFFSTGFSELQAVAAVLGAGGVVQNTAELLAPGSAPVDAGRCTARGDRPPYRLALRSLTGPGGAHVTIRVMPRTRGCAAPTTLAKVQLHTFGLDGSPADSRTLTAVAAPGGRATIDLAPLVRRQHVAAGLLVQAPAGATYFLRGEAVTLLRPRLVVAALTAPAHGLVGRAVTVRATVAERAGDVGANGRVTISSAGAVLASSRRVAVRAGGRATVSFRVTLPAAGPVALDAGIVDALPRAADTTATRRVSVEAADFALDRSQVIVPHVAGYGSQFNHHAYAKLSRDVGVSDANVPELEQKLVALQPQFVRVFFHPSAFADPDRMDSFVRTVLLAQRAGATIDVTWQGGRLDEASGTIGKFADVLLDLVQKRGVTNLRWVTLQNEPNSTRMTPEQYETMYRQLDPHLKPIRDQVRYLGGDLVGTVSPLGQTQEEWIRYLATHMGDLLDAWSVHVFWDYGDTSKLSRRLTEVRAIVDALPKRQRRPLYVAEYGVRGLRTFDGAAQIEPGVWSDGTPMAETNVSAFQHAWFDVLSARLGYHGTSNWDSYFGKYDNGSQAYWMIGRPQDGWPLLPVYHVLRLWTSTVKPGWSVLGVNGSSGSKLVTAYAGPQGQLTLIGLDTAGAQLNGASDTQVTYRLAGLEPGTQFRLLVWNRNGDGRTVAADPVVVDAHGVATVTAPLQSVFALTTLP